MMKNGSNQICPLMEGSGKAGEGEGSSKPTPDTPTADTPTRQPTPRHRKNRKGRFAICKRMQADAKGEKPMQADASGCKRKSKEAGGRGAGQAAKSRQTSPKGGKGCSLGG